MIGRLLVLLICFGFVRSQCPNDAFEWQSSCLVFDKSDSGFANAEIACRGMNGHLASIHDAFTNAVVGQEASKFFQENGVKDFWIGFNKLMVKGNWTWSDGTPFDYNDWKKGEPKNVTGNDCVAQSWIDGTWSAQDCFKLKPYVCSVPKGMASTTVPRTTLRTTRRPYSTVPPTISGNGSCPTGWTYSAQTGFCYGSLYQASQNQSIAESRCVSLGGHLASIHSLAEMQVVETFVIQYCHSIWLGLYSADGGQTWQWTDGTPFDYISWESGNPSSDPTAACVTMDGQCIAGQDFYHNRPCSDYWPISICKKAAQ